MITTKERRTVEEPVGEPMITTSGGLLDRRGLGEGHHDRSGLGREHQDRSGLGEGQQDEEDPGFKEPWKMDWFALPPN